VVAIAGELVGLTGLEVLSLGVGGVASLTLEDDDQLLLPKMYVGHDGAPGCQVHHRHRDVGRDGLVGEP
jgi:hypothetical protein